MMQPLLIGGTSVTAAGSLLAYAVRGRSAQIFGRSIYRGDRSRRAIALTFDDGPSEATPLVLEILKKHNVRATFFMCGQNVERLPHIARAVAEAGHEIGNHSDTHPRFDFCSGEFIYRELATAQEKIARATGVTPRLFRAPYGVRWFGVRSAQERLHLTGVMWTLIARDWVWPAERIASLLETRAGAGEIVCLHDGRTTQTNPDIHATIDALETALPKLHHRALAFETVSDIVGNR